MKLRGLRVCALRQVDRQPEDRGHHAAAAERDDRHERERRLSPGDERCHKPTAPVAIPIATLIGSQRGVPAASVSTCQANASHAEPQDAEADCRVERHDA